MLIQIELKGFLYPECLIKQNQTKIQSNTIESNRTQLFDYVRLCSAVEQNRSILVSSIIELIKLIEHNGTKEFDIVRLCSEIEQNRPLLDYV